MPYRLEQSGSGYYVIGPNGRKNRRPLPRARAERYMRALYANEPRAATKSRYTHSYKATGAPGELLAPGVRRIRGNLCNVHGKYGPCDKADLSGKDPKRDANRTKIDQELGLFEDAAGALTDLADGKPITDDGGLVAMGLAEANPDGTFRLTGPGKALASARNSGNSGNARNALDRGRAASAKRGEADQKRQAADTTKRATEAERVSARAQRDAERRQRQTESDERRAQRQADSDRRRQERDAQRAADQQARQNAPKPPPVDRAAERARQAAEQQATNRASVRSAMAASDSGLSPSGFDAFVSFADGGILTPAMAQGLTSLGLVEGSPPRMTRAAEDAIKAINSGNIRKAVDTIAKATEGAQTPAPPPSKPARDVPPPRAPRIPRQSGKGFAIFKDAQGRMRWVTRTTTAFKDRDREILSMRALGKAVARMHATKQYGPLRWWHLGQPQQSNPIAPWGPGVDLGMGDYAQLVGRTLVESGTFYDDRVGKALAQKASRLEVSPGFFYDATWRQPDGTFTDIIIFERSLVPTDFGRASNYFTGFAVKESPMLTEQEVTTKLGALKAVGVPENLIAVLAADIVQGEKSADTQGIAYKAPPLQVYTVGTEQYVMHEGSLVALKEFAAKAPMAPSVMVQAGETEAADGIAREVDEGDATEAAEAISDDNFVNDLTIREFKDVIRGILQEGGAKIAEMEAQLSSMGFERRQKEADTAMAALTAQQNALQAQLKAVTDQLAALTDDSARPGGTGAPGFVPSINGQVATPEVAVILNTLHKSGANGAQTPLDDLRLSLFPGQ